MSNTLELVCLVLGQLRTNIFLVEIARMMHVATLKEAPSRPKSHRRSNTSTPTPFLYGSPHSLTTQVPRSTSASSTLMHRNCWRRMNCVMSVRGSPDFQQSRPHTLRLSDLSVWCTRSTSQHHFPRRYCEDNDCGHHQGRKATDTSTRRSPHPFCLKDFLPL